MIAMALACEPQLLIADEPTTALDVTVQLKILDLLKDLQQDRQMSMILVTHDLGVVAGRAHDIAVMYAGQIVEQATAQELFRRVRHPYTEALLRSIPKLDMASHTRLSAIDGRPPDLVNLPTGCKFADRCTYAQDRCRTEEPVLQPDANDPTHLVACHFPVGLRARSPPGRRRLMAGIGDARCDPRRRGAAPRREPGGRVPRGAGSEGPRRHRRELRRPQGRDPRPRRRVRLREVHHRQGVSSCRRPLGGRCISRARSSPRSPAARCGASAPSCR